MIMLICIFYIQAAGNNSSRLAQVCENGCLQNILDYSDDCPTATIGEEFRTCKYINSLAHYYMTRQF